MPKETGVKAVAATGSELRRTYFENISVSGRVRGASGTRSGTHSAIGEPVVDGAECGGGPEAAGV